MMKLLLALILFAFSSAMVMAAPCHLSGPAKPDLKLSEVQVSVTRDVNGIEIFALAWPLNNPDLACCNVSKLDGANWRDIFERLLTPGDTSVSLESFALSVGATPGSRNLHIDPVIVARCQTMSDKIINPFRVVRNPLREDGARPMFTRDSRGEIVNLAVDGVQVYVLPGRVCERNPIIQTTPEGVWNYVTNAADIRGISLCRRESQ